MKLLKQVLTASALFLMLSGAAFAHSKSYSYSGGGCGGGGSQTSYSCDNPQTYSKEFTTTDFTKSGGYDFFGFDAITAPGDNFKITSAQLSVTTTGAGYLYAQYSGGSWTSGTYFSSGTTVFTIASSLYDEILAGIDFAAWLQSYCHSTSNAVISLAKLTIEGKYCPPVSQVPVPAAAFLFAPALLGFVGLRRRSKKA